MTWTFADLRAAVLKDSFPNGRTTDAGRWINYRLAELWDAEEWVWCKAAADVTVNDGDTLVADLPSDFLIAVSLVSPRGIALEAIPEYREYARRFLGTDNAQSGEPLAFTVLGEQMFVGPTPAPGGTYKLVYERRYVPMAADDDPLPTGFPDVYGDTVVAGAKAWGFQLTNSPLAAEFEANYQAGVEAMRHAYLVDIRGSNVQMPAYRPGSFYWVRG